jgi:hypothetical protein
MDNESGTLRESYACFQIGVENRDSHHVSQSEIAGAKRISQHLSKYPNESVSARLLSLVSDYATYRELAALPIPLAHLDILLEAL